MFDKDESTTHAESGATRRSVLMGAGAVGALGVLAACGGDSGGNSGGGPTTAAEPTEIKTTDVPVGSGTIYKSKNVVVTQPVAGTFKAFDATCRHQGCQVATVTSTINCTCHGSRYSITDGSVQNPPATQPLIAKTATVSGDTITVS